MFEFVRWSLIALTFWTMLRLLCCHTPQKEDVIIFIVLFSGYLTLGLLHVVPRLFSLIF